MSTSQKEFFHPKVGKYTVVKRKNSKSVRLTIKPGNNISVSIPWYTTYKTATLFVESKKEWIASAIIRQRERDQINSLINKSNPVLKTLNGDIILQKEPANPSCLKKKPIQTTKDNNLTIKYNSSHTRAEISFAAEEALRQKAKEYLPQKVAQLAKKHRFHYNRVYIKKNRSNWGSCSSLGNINLNIHLMRLPEELCDYVIIHELSHLIHRNHGEEFHSLLDHLTKGKSRTLASMLRKYKPIL